VTSGDSAPAGAAGGAGATVAAGTAAGRLRLDPDERAALEEERDHLARSLRDLDAELAAGDLSPEDHATLREDYVARTAEVLRALDTHQTLAEQRRAASANRWGPRRLLVGVAVGAFAVVSGLLVARLAGTRTTAETITGDIRASTRQELATCLELAGAAMRAGSAGAGGAAGAAPSGDLLDAVRCYSDVLARSPGNAEALTYRGWLLVRTGNAQLERQAADDFDAAVASDPAYPDARAFRAIVFYRLGEFDAAAAELAVLDTLDPPPIIDNLLAQFGVRQGIAAARTSGAAPPATTPGPATTGR
jgi:cytochrome c-type biogenesis protein CcmH/NrfG